MSSRASRWEGRESSTNRRERDFSARSGRRSRSPVRSSYTARYGSPPSEKRFRSSSSERSRRFSPERNEAVYKNPSARTSLENYVNVSPHDEPHLRNGPERFHKSAVRINDDPADIDYTTPKFIISNAKGDLEDAPTVIPEFDPEKSQLTCRQWLHTVEQVAAKKKWTQEEKKYHMAQKLVALGKQWCLSTINSQTSWIAVKTAFINAFPSDMDYGLMLENMIGRKKQPNESYASYFNQKLSLLDSCSLTGSKAISCIIAGLPRSTLRKTAFQQSFSEVNALYDFLRAVELGRPKGIITEAEAEKKKTCYNCGEFGHVKNKCVKVCKADVSADEQNQVFISHDKSKIMYSTKNNQKCFKCGEYGHVKNKCQKAPKANFSTDELNQILTSHGESKITYAAGRNWKCLKYGGYEHAKKKKEKTRRVDVSTDEQNQTLISCDESKIMYGALDKAGTIGRCFVDVRVNSVLFRGCIDFKSSVCMMREETAKLASLEYEKTYQSVTGFNGFSIPTLGQVSAALLVDNGFAIVDIFVVPDHIQAIPVIVGQSFLRRPDILVMQDAKSINIYQQGDNSMLNLHDKHLTA